MTINSEMKNAYDNLIRRVKLLGVKKHQTAKNPISLRLTDVELGLVNDLCYISGFNRSTVIKFCIQGCAQSIAYEEEQKRINKILGVE